MARHTKLADLPRRRKDEQANIKTRVEARYEERLKKLAAQREANKVRGGADPMRAAAITEEAFYGLALDDALDEFNK